MTNFKELMEQPMSRRDFLAKGGKTVGAAMLLSSMGGLIAACGNVLTGANGQVKEIVFQTWTVEAKEVIDAQIALFNEVAPDVTVKLEILSYDDYWSKMPITIAGGAGPDLFIMTRPNFETFARSGQAADLTPMLDKSAALRDHLSKMNAIFVDTYKYKGVQRGVPFGVDSTGIVYNKTLLAKEGIRPLAEIENDYTWDDLREFAIALTKRNGSETTQYGYLVPAHRMPTFEYIWSNGAELFTPSGDACVMASKEGTQAIEYLARLMLEDKVSPTPTFTKSQSADDLFLSGKIAIMNAGNFAMGKYRDITDFEWDVAEIPLSPFSRKKHVSSNVLGYIVGPNAKGTDTIMKLLEQLTAKEAQSVYAEKGVFVPTRSDAQDPFFALQSPANLKAFQRALSYSKPMALSEFAPYPTVLRVVTEALEAIYGGTATSPAERWKQAEDELNAVIAETKAKG